MRELNKLAERVLAMCIRRDWSLHWTARGSYLHLESSELIEAVRGKGDSPVIEEAADVLLVLMSITQNARIPFGDVIDTMKEKLSQLETIARYKNEEILAPNSSDQLKTHP